MSGVFLNNFYDNYIPYKTEKDFDQLIKAKNYGCVILDMKSKVLSIVHFR